MGEMAGYFLEEVIEEEYQRDLYATGEMDMYEAFERGYLDSSGCEQECMSGAYERNGIPTVEYLNNQLEHSIKDLEIASMPSKTRYSCKSEYSDEDMINILESHGYKVLKVSTETTTTLNEEAINNLKFETPTCNICRERMLPQEGKFGKFYYCGNYCEGQKTVSDKYWQSVRVNKEK